MAPADYVVAQLKSGELKFAIEDPEAEENHPRILSLWRSNLFGSSAKGNEYFLKHLLGTDHALSAHEADPGTRPAGIVWPEKAAEGKLDLLTTLDFRMTSSTLFSDVVLPAATWYEKHDLSTTDMHPFVHSFNPAIAPPWQSKTDWETWKAIAKRFSNSPSTTSASARTSSPSRSGTTPPRRWPPSTGGQGLAAPVSRAHPGQDSCPFSRSPSATTRRPTTR
jgi:nitrate reductase alpha subunit